MYILICHICHFERTYVMRVAFVTSGKTYVKYASSRWFVTPYAVEGADISTGVGAHEPKLQAA